MVVEDVEGQFAASFSTVLDPTQHHVPADPGDAATLMLLAPLILDVRPAERSADVLVCHLAGGVSATARQRQVVVPEGLLVLTFTAATSRWAELAGLADELLGSLEAAA
jgi:hypothetical protein